VIHSVDSIRSILTLTELHDNPNTNYQTIMAPRSTKLPFSFLAKCKCGQVNASVRTLPEAPPIRLVCYCKDCRGYFETMNRHAKAGFYDDPYDEANPPAKLDNWGGIDWTTLYPRDITVLDGKDFLTTTKIRGNSKIRHVHSTCCGTPMFRCGEMSVLLNSNSIIDQAGKRDNGEEVQSFSSLPVTFRIIGRDAWKIGRMETAAPKMSSSVPFRWFYTMPFHIHKSYMEPMPLEIPKAEDCKVLDDFRAGSTNSKMA
jgi:hypothetical protein